MSLDGAKEEARRIAHAAAAESCAALLGEIAALLRRFVVMSGAQARVVALWTVHTHVIDASDATPYLAITSAEKRSGKTRLLDVLELLVARPWFTGRTMAAVLSRKIDATAPTLLLDESDAAFGGDKDYAEALRGVLNTGHRRGGKSTVCIGQGANIGFKDSKLLVRLRFRRPLPGRPPLGRGFCVPGRPARLVRSTAGSTGGVNVSDLVDHARRQAEQGERVHPLRPGGKTPTLKGWQAAATTDPDRIAEWWERWPDANVGVCIGQNSTVVDIDTRAAHEQFRERVGDPETPVVRSPRGGWHYLFAGCLANRVLVTTGWVFYSLTVDAEV